MPQLQENPKTQEQPSVPKIEIARLSPAASEVVNATNRGEVPTRKALARAGLEVGLSESEFRQLSAALLKQSRTFNSRTNSHRVAIRALLRLIQNNQPWLDDESFQQTHEKVGKEFRKLIDDLAPDSKKIPEVAELLAEEELMERRKTVNEKLKKLLEGNTEKDATPPSDDLDQRRKAVNQRLKKLLERIENRNNE